MATRAFPDHRAAHKIAQMVIARHEQAELVELRNPVRQRARRRRLRLDRHDGEIMMLRLSRKTLLALEAVIDIAFNARPEPVQAKEITARQGVPQRYLEQVMQQLVRAGILKGVRGPRGGYRLARERRRISVGDVVRVAESIEDEEEKAACRAPTWASASSRPLSRPCRTK